MDVRNNVFTKEMLLAADTEGHNHSVRPFVSDVNHMKVVQFADDKAADIREIYRRIILYAIEENPILLYYCINKEVEEVATGSLAMNHPVGSTREITFRLTDYINILQKAVDYKISCNMLLSIICKNIGYILTNHPNDIKPVLPSHNFKTMEIEVSKKLIKLINASAKKRGVTQNQQITDILFDRVPAEKKDNKKNKKLLNGSKEKIKFVVKTSEFKKRFVFLDEVKDKLYNYYTDNQFTEIKITIPMKLENSESEFIVANKHMVEKTIYRSIFDFVRMDNSDKTNMIKKATYLNSVVDFDMLLNPEKYTEVLFRVKFNDKILREFNGPLNNGIITIEEYAKFFVESNKSIDLLDATESKLYRSIDYVDLF